MNARHMLIVSLVLVLGVQAAADDPVTQAQAYPAGRERLGEVRVVSIEGQAEKQLPAEGKLTWQPLREGQTLHELTIIRTGLRSRVVLKLEGRNDVVIKAATRVGITELRRDGAMVRTRLGLQYGSMRVAVDSSRGPNDFRVSTPVAILSVRGTSGEISYAADAGLRLIGTSGTWRVLAAGRDRNVSAGESTDGELTPSIELAMEGRGPRMGDAFGLTSSEEWNLLNNGDGRGIIRFLTGFDESKLDSPVSKPLQRPNRFQDQRKRLPFAYDLR